MQVETSARPRLQSRLAATSADQPPVVDQSLYKWRIKNQRIRIGRLALSTCTFYRAWYLVIISHRVVNLWRKHQRPPEKNQDSEMSYTLPSKLTSLSRTSLLLLQARKWAGRCQRLVSRLLSLTTAASKRFRDPAVHISVLLLRLSLG